MAHLHSQDDPQYARQMQWCWQEHGSPRSPGIGGAYPGFSGYGHVMLDESLPAAAPGWQTELFPDAGAVFRAHFPGEHETYLHYIQGPMHQHYDFDEGSFILWGKGQPLCEDFAYYGRAPAADHSRIDDGFYEALGLEGKIQEFAAGTGTDYLRGERHGWQRQILFVKDDYPLGPNYFVIRDTQTTDVPYDWRVWIATDEPPPLNQNPLRAKGLFGVDLVVYFLEPRGAKPASETATRTTGASGYGADQRSRTQRSLHLKQPAGQPTSVVLFPVMQTQPTPKFTPLAEGRAVKIEGDFGTDYAMLGLEPFQLTADGIVFEGKAGAVQLRGKAGVLSLPRQGKLTYRGGTLQADADPATTVTRRFE
jgi:hypothetical protein